MVSQGLSWVEGILHLRSQRADITKMYQHSVRMTVHYGHLTDEGRLACGRPRTAGFNEALPEEGVPWPRCGDCFTL